MLRIKAMEWTLVLSLMERKKKKKSKKMDGLNYRSALVDPTMLIFLFREKTRQRGRGMHRKGGTCASAWLQTRADDRNAIVAASG